MTFYQIINISTILFVGTGLVKGLVDAISNTKTSTYYFLIQNLDILILSLFILAFKVKTMLDDHQYFGEEHQGIGYFFFHLGFILALFSWVFLSISAFIVNDTQKSSELIIISLAISTAWMILHLFEILLDREKRSNFSQNMISLVREKWIFINMGYILLLGTFIGWLDPVVRKGNITSLYLLSGLLFIDFLTSRAKLLQSLKQLIPKSDK